MSHTKRRKLRDRAIKGVVYFCAGITVVLVVGLLGYILIKGLPEIDWQLLSTKPSTINDTIGILPNLLNTL